jgi:hypothetical protein
MTAVLTAASKLICPHGFPMIVTAGSRLLTVDGQPVLVKGDLARATFACTASGTGVAPCTKVDSVDGGLSTTLTVGGDAVVLATVTGTTNGAIGGKSKQPFSVASVNQTKLEAA